jgi:hypothetical protein
MSDDPKLPLAPDLDFGPPATPAADDPFGALATELTVELEQDLTRRRERETTRQLEMIRERGAQLEVAAPAALELEVDLRAASLDFEADGDVSVSRRVIRTEVGSRSPLLRALARATTPLRRLLSLGADPENLPRVVRGLALRTVTIVASVGIVVTLLAGKPGSAFDLTYAPEAALVRHQGGLAPVLAAEGTGAGATGIGAISDTVATGLLAKARDLLDRFDAAVASGDTTALAAAFADSTGAAPWVAGAARLHAGSLHRAYLGADPHNATPALDPSGDTSVTMTFGGPIFLLDLQANGSEADRRWVRALVLRFSFANGTWQLYSATYLS